MMYRKRLLSIYISFISAKISAIYQWRRWLVAVEAQWDATRISPYCLAIATALWLASEFCG